MVFRREDGVWRERKIGQQTNIWRNKMCMKRKLFSSPNTSHHHNPTTTCVCRKKETTKEKGMKQQKKNTI
jgi:hypothetical protein